MQVCFNSIRGVFENISRRLPFTFLTQKNNCRTAEQEVTLLFTSQKLFIPAMGLHDFSDTNGTDFDVGEAPEVFGFKNRDVSFILDENLVFILKRQGIN